MWELLLEIFGPFLLEVAYGVLRPKGNVKKIYEEAKACYYSGRFTEAEPLFRRALCLCTSQFGEQSRSTSFCHNFLALTLQKQEHYDEAEPHFETALKLCKQLEGPKGRNVAHVLANLGLLCYLQGT